jgi:hypothetical protein
MRAEVWPGSPAADHVTLLNTLGATALLLVVILVTIAGLLLIWDHACAKGRADDFAADHIPECADVAEAVAVVDAAMSEKAGAR